MSFNTFVTVYLPEFHQAILEAWERLVCQEASMKAVVMAGGEGSRLRPLTIRRPKPMVPIAGKPVMEHILNLLKRHRSEERRVGKELRYQSAAETYTKKKE